MSDLAPCPACKRHVRVGAASCPFCAAAVPALRSRNSVPRALTRAAIFTAALAGCQTKAKAPNPTAGSAIEVGSSAPIVTDAAAAAPPVTDAGEAAATDAAVIAVDAGAGSAVSPIQKKNKTTRFEPKAKLGSNSDGAKPEPELVPRDPHPIPKPYGAPPARRRVV